MASRNRDGLKLFNSQPHAHGTYVNHQDVKTSGFQIVPSDTYLKTALAFAKKVLPKNASFRVADGHYVGDNGVAHVHLKQTHNEIDIINADMNINIAKDGSVLSYGNSFVEGEIPSSKFDEAKLVSPLTAYEHARSTMGLNLESEGIQSHKDDDRKYTLHHTGAYANPTMDISYYKTADNQVKPVWSVSVDMYNDWYEAVVDAESGTDIMHSVSHAKDATYKVYPWRTMDPTMGERVEITDPWDLNSSPFTWHGDGKMTYHTTRGNNVIAQVNWNYTDHNALDNYRPKAHDDRFVYHYDPSEPKFHKYRDASVTQLFYTVNTYHDVLYALGFTERAGNFQFNNGGQDGEELDWAICNAQDVFIIENNGRFITRPDGRPGRMFISMWNRVEPERDGAFEADVPIHEYTHGLTNRLTGGPDNTRCLLTYQARSMDEGWADIMPSTIRITSKDKRNFVAAMAPWASNNATGIRDYAYSTNMKVNPWTLKDISGFAYSHNIGAVWATILYEVLWNLIDEYPIDSTDPILPILDDKGVPKNGNFLFMKYIVDGLALQDCNPTFISARDAILDAEKALTDCKNKCLLWKGFAKRGLGVDAKTRGNGTRASPLKATESFKLPAECK